MLQELDDNSSTSDDSASITSKSVLIVDQANVKVAVSTRSRPIIPLLALGQIGKPSATTSPVVPPIVEVKKVEAESISVSASASASASANDCSSDLIMLSHSYVEYDHEPTESSRSAIMYWSGSSTVSSLSTPSPRDNCPSSGRRSQETADTLADRFVVSMDSAIQFQHNFFEMDDAAQAFRSYNQDRVDAWTDSIMQGEDSELLLFSSRSILSTGEVEEYPAVAGNDRDALLEDGDLAFLDLFDENLTLEPGPASDAASSSSSSPTLASTFDEMVQVDLFKSLVSKLKLTPRSTPRSPMCPHVKRHRATHTPRLT